jgi:hypothetical protein
MTQNTITAGDAVAPIAFAGGDDGGFVIKTGAAGSKVNAVSYAADGTPTQIKGTTLGSAPTPVPSGSAPLFGIRAWCMFNGDTTGTNAPTAGGNVASVTRLGTGAWTINFTTPMPDTNFAIAPSFNANTGNVDSMYESSATARTTTSVTINVNANGTAFDPAIVSIMVIR